MDGFKYERLEKEYKLERHEALLRRGPNRPHPYVQLAHVLYAHGEEVEARHILFLKEKRKLEERLGELSRVGRLAQIHRRVFGAWFGFGLKPNRALWTFAISFAVGWGTFSGVESRGMMVVAEQPVATYVNTADTAATNTARKTVLREGKDESAVPCRDNIRTSLYALDVLIPVIDLREEGKCDIDTINAKPEFLEKTEVSAYRFFKAAYAIWGWIFTSLALLTFSGVMRHRLSKD